MDIEAAILVGAISGAAGIGGALATARATASRAADKVEALRAEIIPIVELAKESLRQSSAAFRQIDDLRREAQAQAGKLERLDERTSFLKNTARFRLKPEPEEGRD
jgi:hypothetical protein